MLPKTRRGFAASLLIAAFLAFSPPSAHADAGISMLPLPFPTMMLFMLLVIAIEFIYLQARLRPHFLRTFFAVGVLNVATTGLGFPLTWLIYSALNAWAGFPGGESGVFHDMQFVPMWVFRKIDPDWAGTRGQPLIVLSIFIILLIPSYLFTRILKTWAICWYDLLRYNGDPRAAIIAANRLSYLLLAVTGGLLIYQNFHGI